MRKQDNKIQAKPSGRKCSICQHPQLVKINKWIRDCQSFRAISRQISGNEQMRDSIRRHTENCLNLEIQALIKEKKIENAVDHYQQITEQLAFAKELRIAAREYLSDEHGNLTLIPRTDEIDVIYTEFITKNDKPGWVKKTERLDVLLEKIEDTDLNIQRTVIKHVDIRQFALNAINTVDTVLDKVAKIEGLYQQDKPNQAEIKVKLAGLIMGDLMSELNYTRQQALEYVVNEYGVTEIEVLNGLPM